APAPGADATGGRRAAGRSAAAYRGPAPRGGRGPGGDVGGLLHPVGAAPRAAAVGADGVRAGPGAAAHSRRARSPVPARRAHRAGPSTAFRTRATGPDAGAGPALGLARVRGLRHRRDAGAEPARGGPVG